MEIDQRCINFIQMLEREYKVDIKRTVDYVEIRNKWVGEGSRVPKPKVVRHRASKVAKKGIQRIAWNPKELPMRWDDLL